MLVCVEEIHEGEMCVKTKMNSTVCLILKKKQHTSSLEVERYQLRPAEPHGDGVIVGRLEPRASGVDPGQLQAVVLQELLPLGFIDVLLCLGLGKG